MTDLEKWIEAALTVADTTCMKDSEIIPTWPSDVAGFYPTLTIGALREWQVSQAKHNPDYRTVANRAIGDIARVTELLGVPEEEAGRPIVELVQEFLEAREQEDGEAVASGLPPFDPEIPRDEQGLYSKFLVRRFDGNDAPGCRHHGCTYFVLDVNHDEFAPAALGAYAEACKEKYPALAKDLYENMAASPPQSSGVPKIATDEMLDEGVQALIRGLKSFPGNYTQVVSNIWEDMAATLSTTPQPGKPHDSFGGDVRTEFQRYKRAVITGAERDKVEVDRSFSFADFHAGYRAGVWSTFRLQPPEQEGQ